MEYIYRHSDKREGNTPDVFSAIESILENFWCTDHKYDLETGYIFPKEILMNRNSISITRGCRSGWYERFRILESIIEGYKIIIKNNCLTYDEFIKNHCRKYL